MKYMILAFATLVISLSAQKAEIGQDIDAKLVGSWQGSEKDKQVKGLEKHWVQNRFEDGTYLILFTAIYKSGRVESFAEKGKWWIENGNFYEQHSETSPPEVYSYKFIDDDHVRFKTIDSGEIVNADPDYEFIDIRIKDDNL